MSVLQYLQQLLNQITTAVVLAAQIVGQLITSGWYLVIRDAAILTNDIHALLEDPDCGQQAQCTKLDTVISDLATLAGDIAALGNPQQSLIPVTLPTTPPAGYGGASTSSIADAVWNKANYGGYAMGDTMRSLVYFFDGLNAQLAFSSPTGGPFRITANIGAFNAEPWLYSPDYGIDSILLTDATVGDWLNRVAARGETWTLDTNSLYWVTYGLGQPANNTTWYCTLSEVEFDQIKREIAGTGVLVPPIWPGIANVTLGTPVPLSTATLSVPGPLDGVIVQITSVNQPLPHYWYGAAEAWGKMGGLTFVDDNGEAEEYQLFGFVDAIYCPKAMVQAASCEVRNISGIVGTVTPWTKN